MTIPIPTIDQITGKTVMQKIRSLIENYLSFAGEVVTEVTTIESGEITAIVTTVSETNITVVFTFRDESTETVTIPTAGKLGETFATGLLSLAQYNKIEASLNDVAYSSTAQTFTISFTDNAGQAESVTVPIVSTVAGILTPEMYNAILTSLNNKVNKIAGKGLSTNDFTDAEKTKLAGITAALQYRGTVTNYADLPSVGQSVGDVWNVENGYLNYPPGTNFAWTGSAWDALGGSIDLSDFVTNGQLTTALSGKQDNLTPGTGIDISNNVIGISTDTQNTINGKLDKNNGTAGTTKLYAVVNQAQQMVDLPASVAQFTNNSLGTIKGSTDDYKISANADGTGTVNGLTALESDVMQNASDIATLNTAIQSKPSKTYQAMTSSQFYSHIQSLPVGSLVNFSYYGTKTTTDYRYANGTIVITSQGQLENIYTCHGIYWSSTSSGVYNIKKIDIYSAGIGISSSDNYEIRTEQGYACTVYCVTVQ